MRNKCEKNSMQNIFINRLTIINIKDRINRKRMLVTDKAGEFASAIPAIKIIKNASAYFK